MFDRAILEAVLVSSAAALIGVQVVLRRRAFFTTAMTHATFPGVVLAALLGISLYVGGAVIGLLAALAVVGLSRRRGHDPSAATAVALACGFALGVALQSAQNGFTKDLSAYLVGSILTVSTGDLYVAGSCFSLSRLCCCSSTVHCGSPPSTRSARGPWDTRSARSTCSCWCSSRRW